jgi:CelD/BcsL family acetyltransferase involved in cellulose biosynthesis
MQSRDPDEDGRTSGSEHFGLRLAVCRSGAALAALSREWDDLHARSLNRVPHTRYGWISLCWDRHSGDRGSAPFVVTVRAGDRLVLAIPLRSQAGPFGLQVISWLDSKTPFYSDLLMEDSAAGRAATRMAARFLCADRTILRFRFNHVLADATAHHLLALMPVAVKTQHFASQLDLTEFADAADFLRRLPARLRYDYRHTVRVLQGRGEPCFSRAASDAEIAEAVTWLFSTKTAQFGAKGVASPWLEAPGTRTLFEEACRIGLTDGSCAIHSLRVSDSIVAAELYFSCEGNYFLSKTAADRSHPGISPGSCLRLSMIMDAIGTGGKSIDFMLGDDAWKHRMRSGTKAVASYRAPGHLLARVTRAWHRDAAAYR